MVQTITVSEDLALQASGAMTGEPSALTQPAAESDSRGLSWRVPLTSRTVYKMEALHRLALEHGAAITFELSGPLSDGERAFAADYLLHRQPSLRARLGRAAAEWGAGARECFDALVRMSGNRTLTDPAALDSVVIIGAYGGDHIGDAAILGGLLLDLHRRYGVRRATVLSGRAAHTARLADGLSLPVDLTVDEYRANIVDRLLDSADALVLGGGPLFDAPRMLARHIGAVESAKRRSLPFLVERIGLAPFRNGLSMWAARRILAAATRISVRSAAALDHPVMAGLAAERRNDPAYDYLQTRQMLDRLPARDQADVDQLLAGGEGAIKIAINLRPTHDNLDDLAKRRRPALEPAFAAALAGALAEFAAAQARPVIFISFPMNPLQLGMSDLSASWELERAVGRSVDLRTWWGEPTLDGVLHLLRHVDLAVTMRFHATIFAQSQNVPVIGIDYFRGAGKVTSLLTESGARDDASTVEEFSAGWLAERLIQKARQAAAPAAV